MEKTVLQQKETYMDSVHRWGRIWGLSLMLLILAYPITVSLIFHAQVNWPALFTASQKVGVKYYFIEDESPTVVNQIPQSLKFLEHVEF